MSINYTPLEEAKDATGRTIRVGSVCVYLGGPDHRSEYRGKRVIVRAIKAARLDKFNSFTKGPRKGMSKPNAPGTSTELRVDDGIDATDESHKFQWSAWVTEGELTLLEK